jgi:hypothetical protein
MQKGSEITAYDVKGSKGSGLIIVERAGQPTRNSWLRLPDGKEIPLNRAN